MPEKWNPAARERLLFFGYGKADIESAIAHIDAQAAEIERLQKRVAELERFVELTQITRMGT